MCVQCAKEPVLSFYCCLNGRFDQDRLKMRHTYQRVKSLSVSWPSCLLQDISWSCRGYLDTGVTKSGETIKVINTYVSWQNPSSYQNNYSLRTEPKEKKSVTVEPSFTPSILHLLMILLRTHHPSFHPSHLFKLTESLKGLSWPQLPFWLNRGQLLPWHAQVLAGLTSHLWIQACQLLVSSPPMALTRKRSGSRAEEGRRKGTSDMEGGGEGENRQMDDCWAAGARYEKKTCTLVGGPLISIGRQLGDVLS